MRGRRSPVSLCLVGVAWMLRAASARADDCIAIEASNDALDERGRARLAEQLGAALGQHGIGACGRGATPLAAVTFERAPGGVAIRVHVRDAVTQKEVTRLVRVGSIPADGRPLALAVAADELLRASWAEIALSRAPAPPPPAPASVRAVVEASLPSRPAPAAAPVPPAVPPPVVAESEPPADGDVSAPPVAPRSFSLGASLVGEHAFGGLTQAGADLRAAAWITARLALTLRLGARASPTEHAPDGDADATALLGGAGLAIALVPRGRAVGLEIPLRADVERLQVAGHAIPGARADVASAVTALASTGLALQLRLAQAWSLDAEVTIGAPLRRIEVTDGAAAFTALSSAQLGLAIGVRATP